MNKVGIYVGLFDPVHAGHVAFGLQAMQEAGLDTVCFLPERMPTYQKPVEHYGHRVAMLQRALALHQQLAVIETADKRFVPAQTIPRLLAALQADRLTFLCNARDFIRLLESDTDIFMLHSFVVSVQDKKELQAVTQTMEFMHVSTRKVTLLDALRPDIATEYVQQALSRNVQAPGVLPSVARYARAEWLYADLRSYQS